MSQIFIHTIEVAPSAIDANGHANNVEFVRWMQEAAVAHSNAVGCTAFAKHAGATWVVRSHHVEYSRPAFAGDRVQVKTWVADCRRAFSLRKYEFVRPGNDTVVATVLAKGETDWVFVDIASGKPKSIPTNIAAMFEVTNPE